MNTKGTVFVTGGASGIGLAIARSSLDEGWRVVIADRAQGNLDEARGSFGEHDARLRFESLDVADENAVERAIDRCDTDFGPLVGLVNSAGIFGSETSALETDTGLFRQILEINLIGSFVTSRTAARRMRARGSGSIVNISSISGLRGNFGRVAYGASKAAVIQMTKVMAVELALSQSLAHLRQLEILTSCFTSTFRAEKATWHYITLNSCILEFGGRSTAHFAAG